MSYEICGLRNWRLRLSKNDHDYILSYISEDNRQIFIITTEKIDLEQLQIEPKENLDAISNNSLHFFMEEIT